MDHEDECSPESADVFSEGGMRINAEDGYVIIVRTDRTTQLTTLEVEDPEGVVMACRVLGGEDLQRLRDALLDPSGHTGTSEAPRVLDVSAVIGRD